ncbi:MAG TPA: transporter, partial [Candidatus Methylomirabilis sp.]|nr:transporter [Candidatus Methylomirabilis sp.]
MTRQRILTLCAVGIIVAGCTVGPDYRRPDVTLPSAYRGAGAAAPAPVPAPSFGDLAWWQLFQDP